MLDRSSIVDLVSDGLVCAGSCYRSDKRKIIQKSIDAETNEIARHVLEMIDENCDIADNLRSPLCDDTGIPHLIMEVGPETEIPFYLMDAIYAGVKEGLKRLPGRPMAVVGNDVSRIEQSEGLSNDPSDVEPAPILMIPGEEKGLKLHILMLGGGPAIRGRTYRVFHKHSINTVIDEIVGWAHEATEKLGCTPCTLAIGIGRSQYEASSMMMLSMVKGRYDIQSDLEKCITDKVNEYNVGPLGVGGKNTVLATFLKIGPQRASGVRIVCLRPCCCFEPRIATINL